jgi:hypothetical protein
MESYGSVWPDIHRAINSPMKPCFPRGSATTGIPGNFPPPCQGVSAECVSASLSKRLMTLENIRYSILGSSAAPPIGARATGDRPAEVIHRLGWPQR